MSEGAAGPGPGPERPPPLCERNALASGCLAIFFFFASAFVGMVAARLVVPGSSIAQLLAPFMFPLGWALGWLGVRHLVLACVTLLAPIILPVLLLWLLWRILRSPQPASGATVAPGTTWRPDPTLLLIVPACALTGALVGTIGAFQTDVTLLRAAGALTVVGAAWGLVLAILQLTGVLPDEGPDDSGDVAV